MQQAEHDWNAQEGNKYAADQRGDSVWRYQNCLPLMSDLPRFNERARLNIGHKMLTFKPDDF